MSVQCSSTICRSIKQLCISKYTHSLCRQQQQLYFFYFISIGGPHILSKSPSPPRPGFTANQMQLSTRRLTFVFLLLSCYSLSNHGRVLAQFGPPPCTTATPPPPELRPLDNDASECILCGCILYHDTVI